MAKLSAETQEKIRSLRGRFPEARSGVLPALHYAQAELGHLDAETLNEIAALLGLPPNMTNEVVGFYTMFDKKAPGKYKLEVCRNLSCALMGTGDLTAYLEKKLRIKVGETTSDGKFTLLEAECLGACGYAPMMMVGPYFYEFLDKAKVDAIVGALAEDRPPPEAPAGYDEKDGEPPPPPPAGRGVPTSSQAIREGLFLGGARNGTETAS
jgi:NADH-quinone oxidoreductase subunit E